MSFLESGARGQNTCMSPLDRFWLESIDSWNKDNLDVHMTSGPRVYAPRGLDEQKVKFLNNFKNTFS